MPSSHSDVGEASWGSSCVRPPWRAPAPCRPPSVRAPLPLSRTVRDDPVPQHAEPSHLERDDVAGRDPGPELCVWAFGDGGACGAWIPLPITTGCCRSYDQRASPTGRRSSSVRTAPGSCTPASRQGRPPFAPARRWHVPMRRVKNSLPHAIRNTRAFRLLSANLRIRGRPSATIFFFAMTPSLVRPARLPPTPALAGVAARASGNGPSGPPRPGGQRRKRHGRKRPAAARGWHVAAGVSTRPG